MEENESKTEFEALSAIVEESEKNEESGKSYLTTEQKRAKEYKPKSKEEEIRFLTFDPKTEGTENKFFAKALFHSVKVGEYQNKIYCNKNDKQPCALCNKSDAILATQSKYDKNAGDDVKEKNKQIYKRAMSFKAREYTIFKILDMGTRKDLVKFWRTTTPMEGTSVLKQFVSAIKSLSESYPDSKYYDHTEGFSFNINSAQKTLNTNKQVKYWEVSSIMPKMKPSSIGDEDFIKLVEADKTTWQVIFNKFEIKDVITFEDFLTLCAEGNAPYWNKDARTFIFPNHPELKEKYERVSLERRVNNATNQEEDGDSDEDHGSAIDELNKIEKGIDNNILNKSQSIDEMPDEEEEEDFDGDDDLPF